MCAFHIKNLLEQKKTKFGMVINTDPHYKGGQHWFSIFCNLDPKSKNYGIYYYDSVANAPNKEMHSFMDQIANQVKEVHPKTSDRFNKEYLR